MIERYDVNETWAHSGGEKGLHFQVDAIAYGGK